MVYPCILLFLNVSCHSRITTVFLLVCFEFSYLFKSPNCLLIEKVLNINRNFINNDTLFYYAIVNKSAKRTQNTPVVFLVNSMVMTTFLAIWTHRTVGYTTPSPIRRNWPSSSDCIFIRLGEQIPLIQFLDNSRAVIQECMGDLAGYRTWSWYYAHQHIQQVW